MFLPEPNGQDENLFADSSDDDQDTERERQTKKVPWSGIFSHNTDSHVFIFVYIYVLLTYEGARGTTETCMCCCVHVLVRNFH